MKKRIALVVVAVVLVLGGLTGCGNTSNTKGGWTELQKFTYKDISGWKSMKTPSEGSGAGTVEATNDAEGFVTIKAAADGWGGVESGYFEVDLTKEPIILAKIFENPDEYKWGMKVLPENPISDHEWGLYIIPDNNLKWNKYAGVSLKEVLGQDYIDVYGEKGKMKLWIYPAGGPDATVSVSEILIMNTK